LSAINPMPSSRVSEDGPTLAGETGFEMSNQSTSWGRPVIALFGMRADLLHGFNAGQGPIGYGDPVCPNRDMLNSARPWYETADGRFKEQVGI
jgi:hypothetical protein